MTQLRQQAVKSVFWVGATKIIGQIISMVSSIIVMRILTPADYGLFGMALVYQGILIIIYDLGIGLAVLQKADLTDGESHSAFWLTTIIGLILYVLSWFLAIPCGYFFSNEAIVPLIRVLSISTIFLAIQEIPFVLMAKKFEFKRRGFAELSSGIVGIASCLIMAIMGLGVWSLILSQVFKDLSSCVLIFILSKWELKFYFRLGDIKKMIRYGVTATGQSLLEYFNQSSDSIIIGRFLGQNALGYYQVALSLAKMPITRVIAITNKVTFPVFAKLQNDNEQFRNYFYKVFQLISLFAFPVFLGIFLISEDIIVLILSDKWLPSLFVLRIFCVWAIFRSYTGFLLVILKVKGNVNAAFRYSLYSSILLPASFLIGVNFGISGVAISWMLCFPVLSFYLLFLIKKEIQITFTETFKTVRHAFFGSLLMVISGFFIKFYLFSNKTISFTTMGISIFSGIIVFLWYYYIFSKDTYTEIRSLGKDLIS
ncbi:MAG: lipopolysaccharide biosynthesis protein [Desulfobacula sp.]|nr:lipopolysaccharide biosynthesis protein [Desulfobacula sp.]